MHPGRLLPLLVTLLLPPVVHGQEGSSLRTGLRVGVMGLPAAPGVEPRPVGTSPLPYEVAFATVLGGDVSFRAAGGEEPELGAYAHLGLTNAAASARPNFALRLALQASLPLAVLQQFSPRLRLTAGAEHVVGRHAHSGPVVGAEVGGQVPVNGDLTVGPVAGLMLGLHWTHGGGQDTAPYALAPNLWYFLGLRAEFGPARRRVVALAPETEFAQEFDMTHHDLTAVEPLLAQGRTGLLRERLERSMARADALLGRLHAPGTPGSFVTRTEGVLSREQLQQRLVTLREAARGHLAKLPSSDGAPAPPEAGAP